MATDLKRIALLGATGSIGRQALEIVDAHADLEIVALASGSQPLDELAATHPGGARPGRRRSTELLDASEPDLVLNAVVGFAGVGATLWALERGVTLALANKESLVAAGDLAVAAWKRGGGLLLPVDSEHSAVFQCLEGRASETIDSLVLTASGGPVQKPTARGSRNSERGGGARASNLVHGTEDHHRLGDACEQGARADRGALAVRGRVREDRRRRASDLRRPQPRPLPRRRRARTRGLPRHARADLLRAHVPRAARDAGACARSHGGPVARVRAARPRAIPALPLAREAGERGGTYPCAFNAANEVAVAAFLDERIGFLEIAQLVEDALGRSTGVPPAISPSSSRPTPRRGTSPQGRLATA